MRSAFGHLLTPPEQLPRRERVDELRRVAGRLLADPDAAAQWVGRGLMTWVRDGGDLPGILGVRAPRGSHQTAQALVRLEQRARALIRLSVHAGSDAAALRMLADPDCHHELVQSIRELGAPRHAAAFTRARRRIARHGR